MNRSALSAIADVIFLIQRGAVEKSKMVDEINRQSLFNLKLPQIRLLARRAQRQIKPKVPAFDLRKLFPDTAIERRDDANLVPGARQRLAKRAHHVCQAAGF